MSGTKNRGFWLLLGLLLPVSAVLFLFFVYEEAGKNKAQEAVLTQKPAAAKALIQLDPVNVRDKTQSVLFKASRMKQLEKTKPLAKGEVRVTGRVIDSEKKGIPRAKFRPRSIEELMRDILRDRETIQFYEQKKKNPLILAETAPDGSFSFVLDARSVSLGLKVFGAPHHQITDLSLPDLEKNQKSLDLGDIILKSAASIEGTILDSAGIGTPGLVRCLRLITPDNQPPYVKQLGGVLAPRNWRPIALEEGLEVKADESGHFEFPHLEPGSYMIQATCGDFRASELHTIRLEKNSTKEQNFQFYSKSNLKLLFVDGEGQPISGVSVGLTPVESDGGALLVAYHSDLGSVKEDEFKGISNDKGELGFKTLGFSSYDLSFSKDGHGIEEMTLHFGTLQNIYRKISFRRGAVVEGKLKVVGTSTAKFTGEVYWEKLESTKSNDSGTISVEEDGKIVPRRLSPWKYNLAIFAIGYQIEYRTAYIAPGQEKLDLGDIKLEALATVEVTILDSEGQPVEESVVAVSKFAPNQLPVSIKKRVTYAGYDSSRAFTEKDGRVTFNNVMPGFVSFYAGKEGYPGVYKNSVFVPKAGAKVTLRLPKLGGSIKGRALDDKGKPVRSGFVSLVYKGFHKFLSSAEVNSDGAFQFENLAPGFYKIITETVSEQELNSARDWFEVFEGKTTNQVVTKTSN